MFPSLNTLVYSPDHHLIYKTKFVNTKWEFILQVKVLIDYVSIVKFRDLLLQGTENLIVMCD
jgi:hypothetical protein